MFEILEPCPLCLSKNVKLVSCTNVKDYWVDCIDCGLSSGVDTFFKVLELWNRNRVYS